MPVPVEEVFAYHARPGALDRLLPPWRGVEIVERSAGIADGAEVVLRMKVGGRWRRWVARHHDYVVNQGFSDTQVRGPMARWEHHHRFLQDFENTSILEDAVDYALPKAAFFLTGAVQRDMERMFAFRHERTRVDLLRQGAFRDAPRQTIGITGATGLVGSALWAFLNTAGHDATAIGRSKRDGPAPAGDLTISWDTQTGELKNYRPLDTLVHLAGRNIAERWSAGVKQEIYDSRVGATERLCGFLAKLPAGERPKLLIAASAIGIYGDRGDEELTEASPPPPPQPAGRGFLPDTCVAWEAATRAAEEAGIRVIHLRSGVVLSPKGGVVAKLRLPTLLGLGGPVGSGKQFMPWIALDDLVGLIHYLAMGSEAVAGAVNAVAPGVVRQKEFARALGRVLGRPAVMPLPGLVVKGVFGQMGREVLLGSARVVGTRVPTGFGFLCRTVEEGMRWEMGRYE